MNRDYLLEQFRLIDEYVARAQSIAQRPKADFLKDKILIDAATRELAVLFETCHNIAKHLIASYGWREASSKAEAFEILNEQSILPADLRDSFREASRFRNLVTYQTAIIQDEVVHDVLIQHLTDFTRFVSAVARWLENS